jgi:hypothetical protein
VKGFKTSFVGMYESAPHGMAAVTSIEIPLIQRDYAQGREDPSVQVIRREFLDVLVSAVTGGPRVDLDFVYGEIEDGTLRPLDGQQRLTTLFLLHWYVASRTGRLSDAAKFLRFSYATRPTTDLFCRQLVRPDHSLPSLGVAPSEWITDQAWYLYSWVHDPSVQSMLVMLDAIHARLSTEDTLLDDVWMRLRETADPVISFYFLPIEDMPSGEDLYIKMNSRGKPLTAFETFKARFEVVLSNVLPPREFDELIHKLDGEWTDVLWPYDDGDHVVDDEFLRYLEFIVEVSEWRDSTEASGSLIERAERAFSNENPNGRRNVEFLFHAFDTWVKTDVAEVFAAHFAKPADPADPDRDRAILFDSNNVNLFQECARRYGLLNVKARLFSLSETLLLFAVLIHRQYETDDFQTRLRSLRNLTDRADEVRVERMADLIAGVERLIRDGDLELRGFNPDRTTDELTKRTFVEQNPELQLTLRELEDHPMLRGRVFAFELDAGSLQRQLKAFNSITRPQFWPELTGALLAAGNYGYSVGQRGYQFGSSNPAQELRWREVFTHYGRGRNRELVGALRSLLDSVSSIDEDPPAALTTVAARFSLERRESELLDWRYYLVTYPAMREGDTGLYYGEHLAAGGEWGYSMCMLRTSSLTGSALYRDPFLLALTRESGVADAVHEPWFSGYETEPRWLRLKVSGAGIRCVNEGYELDAPTDPNLAARFAAVSTEHGAIGTGLLPMTQHDHDGQLVDSEDRIVKGAALLRDLLAAGL